jgi:hypothetical protein
LMILLGFIIMESVFKKMPFDFNEKKWYNSNIKEVIKWLRKYQNKPRED